MYSGLKRQFIFKQSSGKVWNFFHDSSEGLCYCQLRGKNLWSAAVSMHKEAVQPFHADMDEDDRFHIVYQDKDGNIFYTLMESEPTYTLQALKSKTPTSYDKHLFVLPLRHSVHLFFTLFHNDRNLLAHQVFSEGVFSTPKVIDYIADGNYPFTVACDRSDGIYVFYQASDGKAVKIGFKKYAPVQNIWGEFMPTTVSGGNCENPRAIVDSKNILHLIYQRKNGEENELVYRQKVPDKNMWGAETIIHSSLKSFDEAAVADINNNIVVFWVRSDIIFQSTSSDMGLNWSKPSRYVFNAGKQLFCIQYKSNAPGETGRIAVRELPGSFINGFRLAFYQAPSESASSMSPDDLRTMIVDSLKLLQGSVEELKDSELKLKSKLAALERGAEDIKKEIEKLSIRLELAETAASSIKALSARVDLLKNDINTLKNANEKLGN